MENSEPVLTLPWQAHNTLNGKEATTMNTEQAL